MHLQATYRQDVGGDLSEAPEDEGLKCLQARLLQLIVSVGRGNEVHD